MGAIPKILFALLVWHFVAIAPAEPAVDVPIFVQMVSQSPRSTIRSLARRVLLSIETAADGSTRWLVLQPPISLDPQPALPGTRLAYASLAASTRAVMDDLVSENLGNFSATSGWDLHLWGLKRAAVAVSWNLTIQKPKTPSSELRALSFRPTFYVPGEGLIEVTRSLTLAEVRQRSVDLAEPFEFLLTRRPSSAMSEGWVLGQPVETTAGSPDGLLSVPGVVVLRQSADHQGVEVLSATLWSSLDPQGPEFGSPTELGIMRNRPSFPRKGSGRRHWRCALA